LALDPTAIAEARKARGWTQEELAAMVGCSIHAVCRWEQGQRVPNPVHELRLTKALRLNTPDSQPAPAA
jgi:transcriptional regulator with XRE-family HTH domain